MAILGSGVVGEHGGTTPLFSVFLGRSGGRRPEGGSAGQGVKGGEQCKCGCEWVFVLGVGEGAGDGRGEGRGTGA